MGRDPGAVIVYGFVIAEYDEQKALNGGVDTWEEGPKSEEDLEARDYLMDHEIANRVEGQSEWCFGVELLRWDWDDNFESLTDEELAKLDNLYRHKQQWVENLQRKIAEADGNAVKQDTLRRLLDFGVSREWKLMKYAYSG